MWAKMRSASLLIAIGGPGILYQTLQKVHFLKILLGLQIESIIELGSFSYKGKYKKSTKIC